MRLDLTDFWLSYRKGTIELAKNITREKPGSGLFLVSCATHAVVNTTWDTMPVATLGGDDHGDHSHHQEELLTTILTNWLNNRTPDKAMDRPDIVNPGCSKANAAAGDTKYLTLLLAMVGLLLVIALV